MFRSPFVVSLSNHERTYDTISIEERDRREVLKNDSLLDDLDDILWFVGHLTDF